MRQCRARRGAPDAALDRYRPGDVQVRPRRRVHRGSCGRVADVPAAADAATL